ncbi:hypothetical protein BA011_30275 (plasmid) [Rhizobium leguminosarum]|uniref:HTH merR-type domain-containing protein n=1 Tax=Rhizobium leguminosarum TaxID=384 RepID=A0A1B1CJM9_RHILE|nr:hypothetical protein BA011_30275 [Rhizobium leguminosarum]
MNHKKKIYRVAEAARLAGVSASTLRLWEKEDLIVPDRSEKGHRRYDADHVTRLKRIASLRKDRRLTIAGIREDLRKSSPETGTPRDASDAIPEMKKRKQLEDENARLNRIVAEQTLELNMLREVHSPKRPRPARKREG